MDTAPLGRFGLRIGRIAIGTATFGSKHDADQSMRLLDAAVDHGVNLVDTSDNYPMPPLSRPVGTAEEIVGRWLGRRDRPEVVVATKCGHDTSATRGAATGSRKYVIESCEASLRRLGRDHVDIYYLHRPELGAPIDETLAAVDVLHRQGKVHYFGLSNFSAWQVALVLQAVAAGDRVPVAVIEPRYNLLARNPERDLLPLASAVGMGVIPYNPVAAGVLAGRFRHDAPADTASRFGIGGDTYRKRYWSPDAFAVADTVAKVADAIGASPAQVAMAWLLRKDVVTSVLAGVSTEEQLEDLVGSLDIHLEDEHVVQLDTVSEPFAYKAGDVR